MPKSREMKLLLAFFIILFAVFMLITLILLEYNLIRISRKITDQNRAMLGAVISTHPELEGEIVAIITKEVPDTEVEIGRAALEKYNYNEFMSHKNQIALSSISYDMHIQVMTLIAAVFVLGMAMFFWVYSRISGKIDRLYMASERVINGDFSVVLAEEGEGSISILNHQFNKMSAIIKSNYEVLNKEKVFLKDAISDISHQLKTPLASLYMFNELMLDDEDMPPETRREFLEKSKHQYERMEWLIVNLLKIARIEAGSIEFKRDRVMLLDVVENCAKGIESKLMEYSQTLEVVGDTQTYFIGDAKWTEEALTNILKNATEHAPKGSLITVRLEDGATLSTVAIKNRGSQLAEKDAGKIFRRFYKSGSKSDSVGIGLNLTKSIIEGQGGMVTASNVYDGVEFVITFMKLDDEGLDPRRSPYIRDKNTAIRRRAWK